MKKLLSLVLAIMMLTLPVIASAQGSIGAIGGADGPTQIVVSKAVPTTRYQDALAAGRRVNQSITLTELAGVETGDQMTDAAIADLVKAIGIHSSAQGDEAELAISLSGKEVANFGGALSGQDVYLASNLMGGAVIVGLDEIESLINRILDEMVTMGAIGEFEVEMIREQVASIKEGLEAQKLEEALEDAAVDDLNFTALEAILPMLMSKVTQVEDIIVPRMCDPAVSGMQLVLTNTDLHEIVKQGCQFLLDNPKLMDVIAQSAGYPTEESIAAEWASAGQLYTTFGIYKDEAAFRAAQKSFDKDLHEVMDNPHMVAPLDGEMKLTVYLDDKDEPVYITAAVPVQTTEEHFLDAHGDLDMVNVEIVKKTVNISLNYTRQTVPQGVAHVGNIFVDDNGVTIDALVGEGSAIVTMTAVEPETEPAKLFELFIKKVASESNPAVTCIDVDAAIYGSDEPTLEIAYDGEYETSDVREYCAGKLTMTTYQRYVDYSGEETTISTNADAFTLEFSTETAINGIDYTTDASFTVEAGRVRFGMQMRETTADPEPSIMSGNVVRPTELSDADFSNWFTGVINAFNVWLAGAFQALPESVLLLIIYSGMM